MASYQGLVAAAALIVCCGLRCGSVAFADSAEQVVGRYEVFEVTLTADKPVADPFRDVKVAAEFVSPRGRKVEVAGFYYGEGKWKVRFAPDRVGVWSFTARLKGPDGEKTVSGKFRCVRSERHGFLRISKVNPYRLQYEDGTPFYPIGAQTCGLFNPGFDGPEPGGEWRHVDLETWCKAFQGAVNLFRLQFGVGTKAGCALVLVKAVKDGRLEYDLELAAKIDEACRTLRRYGFSLILIPFQDMSLWGHSKTAFGWTRDTRKYKSLSAPNLPLQAEYLRYLVARYGCFVDIWEIFNEDSYAPDDYLAYLASVIRGADPYDHIITTNYERPLAPWCELVTPHEYMGIPANQVDVYLAKEFARFKSFGKPVLYTEFGNQGSLPNYDPIKWRVATWTAFMNESGILFWCMSGRKVTGVRRGNSNAYLGPETRKYFRVLQDFVRDLPIDMRPVPAGYTEQTDIRTYGLSNRKVTVVYVHHYADYSKPFQLPYRLQVATWPGRFKVRWIDPATGETVKQYTVVTRQIYSLLKVPPVKVDLACRIDRVE